MAFEGLPTEEKQEEPGTIYRFAEMEIYKACLVLEPMQPMRSTFKRIADHCDLPYDLLTAYRFQVLRDDELVRYYRFYGFSYSKIQKLMGVTTNYISMKRFDYTPLPPNYDGWTPLKLQRWQQLRNLINLWEEPLSHTKIKRSK